jgi:hypothetical protein
MWKYLFLKRILLERENIQYKAEHEHKTHIIQY